MTRLREVAAALGRFELPNLAIVHFVLYDVFAFTPRHWLLDGAGKMLAGFVLDLELVGRRLGTVGL